jgi:hypothetical protein
MSESLSDLEQAIPQLDWGYVGTGAVGEKIYRFQYKPHEIAGKVHCYPDDKEWKVKLRVKDAKTGESHWYELDGIVRTSEAVRSTFLGFNTAIIEKRGHIGRTDSELKDFLRSMRQ